MFENKDKIAKIRSPVFVVHGGFLHRHVPALDRFMAMTEAVMTMMATTTIPKTTTTMTMVAAAVATTGSDDG